MNFDPEHWKAASLSLGMVRDAETGEIRWPVIIGGLLVTGTIAVGGFLVQIGNTVSANSAKIVIIMDDLRELKSSMHPATMKRYTSDDSVRDLELLRTRIRDSRDEARRDTDELTRRIQRLEDKRK